MCRNGFAMNVVAAKRRGQNYSEQADVKRLELDELLSVSDFVVLSCPLTAQTEGLIDKPELSKMEPHCLGKPTDPERSGRENRNRTSDVEGKSVAVRGELGGSRTIDKKNYLYISQSRIMNISHK